MAERMRAVTIDKAKRLVPRVVFAGGLALALTPACSPSGSADAASAKIISHGCEAEVQGRAGSTAEVGASKKGQQLGASESHVLPKTQNYHFSIGGHKGEQAWVKLYDKHHKLIASDEQPVTVGTCGPGDYTAKGGGFVVSQTCTAVSPEKWQPTPSNLAADKLAHKMGVPPEAVQSGTWGPATCEAGLLDTAAGMSPGEGIIAVEGRGDLCTVIGFRSNEAPQAGKLYKDILALCANVTPT